MLYWVAQTKDLLIGITDADKRITGSECETKESDIFRGLHRQQVESMNVRLSNPEFLQFCDFIYRHTGLRFDVSKRYFVDRRLNDAMRETGLESFSEYFTLLSSPDSHERQRLINRVTVNETSFLRERIQLQCLADHILPEIQHRRTDKPVKPDHTDVRKVRIWSIPCSSGEEPYSISLYLHEKFVE